MASRQLQVIRREFYDDMFHGRFVAFCGPWKYVLAYMKSHGWDERRVSGPKAAKTVFCENDKGYDLCIIWIDRHYLRGTFGSSKLAHEALHAARFVLEARGVSDSEILNETGAYYVEWIMAHLSKLR